MNDISHVAFFVPVRVRMDVLTEKKQQHMVTAATGDICNVYIYFCEKVISAILTTPLPSRRDVVDELVVNFFLMKWQNDWIRR
jgi:hypothetical protein